MTPGHVVIITLHADPATASGVSEGGGTHAYLRELTAELARREWTVTVLTRRASPRLPELEGIGPNSVIHRLTIGDVGPVDKRDLHGLHERSRAAAVSALGARPTVSLIHSVYWNSGRVAMDVSEALDVRFVHTVISNGWRRWREGARDQPPERIPTETAVFQRAAAVFCVSSQERSDLIEGYAVAPSKLFVVGRPVGLPFRYPCRDEIGQPRSVHPGTLEP